MAFQIDVEWLADPRCLAGLLRPPYRLDLGPVWVHLQHWKFGRLALCVGSRLSFPQHTCVGQYTDRHKQ